MKPVKQTLFEPGKGNCFAVCVASLLEMPLEDVPHFLVDYPNQDWWEVFQTWLGDRNLFAIEVTLKENEAVLAGLPCGTHCMITGKSPRHDCLHAVVGKVRRFGAKMFWDYIHDPHPDNTMIVGYPKYIAFIVGKATP